jgi:hypothetical protein
LNETSPAQGHAIREVIMIHRESDEVRSAFYLINTSLPGVGIYARISSRITRLFRLATVSPMSPVGRIAPSTITAGTDGSQQAGSRLNPPSVHLPVGTDYILSIRL